jgi:hypothetical protein
VWRSAGALYKKYLNSHIRWLGLFFLMIATAEEKVLSSIPQVNLFDILFEIMSYVTLAMPGRLCARLTRRRARV